MNRLEQARKLGEMLRNLMSEKGWTAREMARQVDVPASSMGNYITGMVFPTKEARERLAKLFNMEITEFDALFGLSTLQPREVDALCRDIRLLSSEDFAIVAKVVFDRAAMELQNSSSPPLE